MVVKKVVFIHPDLGIGGAERLVVDAGEKSYHMCMVYLLVQCICV